MTNDELRRASQRIADARERRRADVGADTRSAATSEPRSGAPFAPGDRVMAVRSGQEGEVSRVGPANREGRALIWVRFDDGGTSGLDARDLLARPRPPAGRS